MRNAVRAVPTVIAIAVGALAAISPAAAEPPPTRFTCEYGYFCIWQNFGLRRIRLSFNEPMPVVAIRGGAVENQDDVDWCVYSQTYYRGQYRRIKVGAKIGSLTDPQWNFPRVRSLAPCSH
jgi:hypothetical protein